MENIKTKFTNLFKSSPFGELLKKGIDLKKADRGTTKRMTGISAVSCVSMTVLSYFALGGIIGAIIFFIIAYSASFYLNYSMKKKVLLAYLKYYREELPSILCEEAEKTDKPRIASTLNSLYPETLNHWTVCYSLDRIDAGFVRIIEGTREIASGFAAVGAAEGFCGAAFKGYFPTLTEEYAEELTFSGDLDEKALEFARILDEHFEAFAIVFGEDFSLIFSPSSQDFMTDRVETPDGLKPESLARQVAYFNIAKAFDTLDLESLRDAVTLFEGEFEEENEIYKTTEARK